MQTHNKEVEGQRRSLLGQRLKTRVGKAVEYTHKRCIEGKDEQKQARGHEHRQVNTGGSRSAGWRL